MVQTNLTNIATWQNGDIKIATPDEAKKTNKVPFVIPYNPALPKIHKILHRKQPILHSSKPLNETFKETPVVAYRRAL